MDLPPPPRWHGGHALVARADAEAFAAETGDDSPALFGPGAVAPPLLGAALAVPVAERALAELGGGRPARLLAHAVALRAPLRPGDVAQLRAWLEGARPAGNGLHVRLRVDVAARGRSCLAWRLDALLPRVVQPPEGAPGLDALPAPAAPPADEPEVRGPLPGSGPGGAGLEAQVRVLARAGAALVRRYGWHDARRLRDIAGRPGPGEGAEPLGIRAWAAGEAARFHVHDAAGNSVFDDGRASVAR